MLKRICVVLGALAFLLPISAFPQQEGLGPRVMVDGTEIPGYICTGDLLTVGFNKGGGFGVGDISLVIGTGFQFPPGEVHESLAYATWAEGWKISYKFEKGGEVRDRTAWWQPSFVGWPPAEDAGFVPVSAKVKRDDDQECLYRVVVKTKDNRLKLTFDFRFRKAYPSVLVTTKIANISSVKLFDVVYARTADWDIHQNPGNYWSSNDHSVFACGNDFGGTTPLSVMSISGRGSEVLSADEYAWDDLSIRGPGSIVTRNRTPYFNDYHGAIHYHLGTLKAGASKKMVTVYSAAFTDQCL